MQKVKWQCRIAPSLGGGFDGTPNETWGTKDYENQDDPTVFFGLYGLPDFYTLWRHGGEKHILWAGSDILHFRKGYWLDGKGDIAFPFQGNNEKTPDFLAKWINANCTNWVENEAEAWQLKDCGIEVDHIQPSFLGNIKNYKVEFIPGNKVYVSANEGGQMEYGWSIVQAIACELPQIEFHLYGATWQQQPLENVIVHGRVSKREMNEEIKKMQCGLRLNKHDGFSEITAKSVLWGQYPITYLYHPKIDQYVKDSCGQPYCMRGMNRLIKLLKKLPKRKKPNLEARDYYMKHINQYPWNRYA